MSKRTSSNGTKYVFEMLAISICERPVTLNVKFQQKKYHIAVWRHPFILRGHKHSSHSDRKGRSSPHNDYMMLFMILICLISELE